MADYWGFNKYSLTMQSEAIKFPTIGPLSPYNPHQLPNMGLEGHNINRCIKIGSFLLTSRVFVYLHCSIQMVSEDGQQLLLKQVHEHKIQQMTWCALIGIQPLPQKWLVAIKMRRSDKYNPTSRACIPKPPAQLQDSMRIIENWQRAWVQDYKHARAHKNRWLE